MLLMLLLLLFGPPAGSWAEAAFDAFSPSRHDFPYCFPCSRLFSCHCTKGSKRAAENAMVELLSHRKMLAGKIRRNNSRRRKSGSKRSGRNCLPHTCTWAGLPASLFASCSLSAFDLLQLPTAGCSADSPFLPHPLSLSLSLTPSLSVPSSHCAQPTPQVRKILLALALRAKFFARINCKHTHAHT